MNNLKEKILEILHEHTRRIIIDGKDKPLIRRAIKNQTADQLLKLIDQVREEQREETKKELVRNIEGIRVFPPNDFKISTNSEYNGGYNSGFNQAIEEILKLLKY